MLIYNTSIITWISVHRLSWIIGRKHCSCYAVSCWNYLCVLLVLFVYSVVLSHHISHFFVKLPDYILSGDQYIFNVAMDTTFWYL